MARPEPEVIANFADGCSYNKTKLEQLFRNGFFDRTAPKALKVAPGKKEDVEVIVTEFEIPKARAEKILAENGGDLQKALGALMSA